MLAVGRCPEQANGLAVGDKQRVHLKHIGHVVPGLRVVGFVQAHGLGVVVDGDVHVPADGLLDAGGRTATACE